MHPRDSLVFLRDANEFPGCATLAHPGECNEFLRNTEDHQVGRTVHPWDSLVFLRDTNEFPVCATLAHPGERTLLFGKAGCVRK